MNADPLPPFFDFAEREPLKFEAEFTKETIHRVYGVSTAPTLGYEWDYDEEMVQKIARHYLTHREIKRVIQLGHLYLKPRGSFMRNQNFNITIRNAPEEAYADDQVVLRVEYPYCDGVQFAPDVIFSSSTENVVGRFASVRKSWMEYFLSKPEKIIIQGSDDLRYVEPHIRYARTLAQIDIDKAVHEFEDPERIKIIDTLAQTDFLDKGNAFDLKRKLKTPIDPATVDDEMLGRLI